VWDCYKYDTVVDKSICIVVVDNVTKEHTSTRRAYFFTMWHAYLLSAYCRAQFLRCEFFSNSMKPSLHNVWLNSFSTL